MGLFGHGGLLSKAAHGVEHAVSEGWKKTEQIASDFWEHGGKEAVTVGGIAAATLLTGGAAAGALGFAGTASALTGTTAFLGATAATGIAGYTGAKNASIAEEERKAQAAYQAEVNKANAQEERNRRANLLSLRKSLQPTLSRSSQGGGGGSVVDDSRGTGGVVLG